MALLYSKQGDYRARKAEFEKDIALEPDVVFNYDELGNVCFLAGDDAAAEKNYRKALSLDPRMHQLSSGAREDLRAPSRIPEGPCRTGPGRANSIPQSSRIHYLRGQTLVHMGRKAEGKKELETSVRMSGAQRDQRQKELEGDPVPSPELTQDNQ